MGHNKWYVDWGRPWVWGIHRMEKMLWIHLGWLTLWRMTYTEHD